MKKVSVIMPCFNDGKYIKESIDCVENQTYKNIELIIINDGSTDLETIRILDTIQNKNIKIINTNKIGPSGARNEGIKYSTGEYILPLDSDDLIDYTYISKAVEIMEKNNNIGIVYCKASFFGEKEGDWDLPEYSINKMLINNIIFVSALFRKDDWQKVGGFDTSFLHGLEDYDFWMSILELGRDVEKIQEVLFRYRIKEISRHKSFENDIKNMKKTYEKIYFKHKKLYLDNINEYCINLRNVTIDEQFIQKRRIEKLTRLPIIRLIISNYSIKNKIKKLIDK